MLFVSIVLGTFLIMESVAWATHKYIMHGIGWSWHKDHHHHHKGFFERNDLYAVVFSIFAISCIGVGTYVDQFAILLPIGIGVTMYGISYFVFHDLIVHRRLKFKFTARSRYMKRIMNAHYMHHKVHTKEGAEAFGFLYALKKYDHRTKSSD